MVWHAGPDPVRVHGYVCLHFHAKQGQCSARHSTASNARELHRALPRLMSAAG